MPCSGCGPGAGGCVRPLLGLGRGELRELAAAAGLLFADDPTNEDPRFARARLRREVLPVLREINPAAEENIAATRAELEEDAEPAGVARPGPARAGRRRGGAALPASALEQAPSALRRLALRALAERVAGRAVALGPKTAAEIWRIASRPEGGEVELGGGLSAVCEAGDVRFTVEAGAGEERAVALGVPGEVRFGRWLVRAERPDGWLEPQGPEVATLDAGLLGEALGAGALEVRAWREGDRMRPLGLGGSKTPPGPVHRRRGAALRCGGPCRWSLPAGGSPGSPGSPSRRSSSSARSPPRWCF